MRAAHHPSHNTALPPADERLPSGFHLLIGAQFASALADNALLIVTIALLQAQGQPGWWAPLLKFAFTISYVLLAPFVGPLADAFPKARLMAWMNGVKTLGILALFVQVHPVLAFAVVGLGAAAYAPAKYGLITEMVPARLLVAANGWIEVSVVSAALLGTVLGGLLVSRWFGALTGSLADPLYAALGVLLLIYGLAALLQLGLRDSGARYPACARQPAVLLREFLASNRQLWRDAEGGLSLAVTTLFWGVGATLQFAVLRWAQQVLGLRLDQGAYLQAVVAVGVVVGAALAGRLVPMSRAARVLPLGVVLGLLLVAMTWVDHLALAWPMMMGVGAVGGLLVVPMNALLQQRGYQLLTAGRSIAVQGYNENLSILVMLAAYAGALALDTPLLPLMTVFGSLIALAMLALCWRQRRASHRLRQDLAPH